MAIQSIELQPESIPLKEIYRCFYKEKIILLLKYSISSCSYYSTRFELKTLWEKELILLMLVHGLSTRDVPLSVLAAYLSVAVPSPISQFMAEDQIAWLTASRYCDKGWIKSAVDQLKLFTRAKIVTIPDSLVESIMKCSKIQERKKPPETKDILLSDILESSIFLELLCRIEYTLEENLADAIDFSNDKSNYSRGYMERMVWSQDAVFCSWQSLFLVLLSSLIKGDILLSSSTIDLLRIHQSRKEVITGDDMVAWLMLDFKFEPAEFSKAVHELQVLSDSAIINIPECVLNVFTSLPQIASPLTRKVSWTPVNETPASAESENSTLDVIEISDDEIDDKSSLHQKLSDTHITEFVCKRTLKKALEEQRKMLEECGKLMRVAMEKIASKVSSSEELFDANAVSRTKSDNSQSSLEMIIPHKRSSTRIVPTKGRQKSQRNFTGVDKKRAEKMPVAPSSKTQSLSRSRSTRRKRETGISSSGELFNGKATSAPNTDLDQRPEVIIPSNSMSTRRFQTKGRRTSQRVLRGTNEKMVEKVSVAPSSETQTLSTSRPLRGRSKTSISSSQELCNVKAVSGQNTDLNQSLEANAHRDSMWKRKICTKDCRKSQQNLKRLKKKDERETDTKSLTVTNDKCLRSSEAIVSSDSTSRMFGTMVKRNSPKETKESESKTSLGQHCEPQPLLISMPLKRKSIMRAEKKKPNGKQFPTKPKLTRTRRASIKVIQESEETPINNTDQNLMKTSTARNILELKKSSLKKVRKANRTMLQWES